MAKKKRRVQTSASLTRAAKAILLEHRNAFSVKAILSVGLELFAALPDDEKTRRISAANSADRMIRAAEAEAAKQKRKNRRTGEDRSKSA